MMTTKQKTLLAAFKKLVQVRHPIVQDPKFRIRENSGILYISVSIYIGWYQIYIEPNGEISFWYGNTWCKAQDIPEVMPSIKQSPVSLYRLKKSTWSEGAYIVIEVAAEHRITSWVALDDQDLIKKVNARKLKNKENYDMTTVKGCLKCNAQDIYQIVYQHSEKLLAAVNQVGIWKGLINLALQLGWIENDES